MIASSPAQPFVTAIFVNQMLAASHLSRATFTLLFGVSAVLSAGGMIGIGRLIDRAPVAAVWTLGAVTFAGSLAVTSLVSGPLLVIVAFVLLRVFGMGLFTMLGIMIVSRTFAANRGRAIAAAILGLTVASVVFPPAVAWLDTTVGWRDAYRLLAILVLATMLPLALAIRAHDLASRPGTAAPVSSGRGYPQAFLRPGRLPFALPGRRMRRLLVTLAVAPVVVNGLLFHATAVLARRGLSLRESAFVISALGIASCVGILTTGVLVDRLRTRKALVWPLLPLTAAPVVALVPTASAGVAAFVLVGLGGASSGVVAGALWPRIWGTARLGSLQGTAAAIQTAGSAAGPLPLALAQSLTGSFVPGFLTIAAIAVIGLGSALRWRDPRHLRRRADGPRPLLAPRGQEL
jgi:MFS family permease